MAITQDELKRLVLEDRQAAYVRLRGGFPIPMAGTVYWAAITTGSQYLEPATLLNYAFYGSGLIFPMALGFAALFRNNFMKDRTATGDVLIPTFISMLLFWPMLVAAIGVKSVDLVMVILAIGLSLHWPVIGWSYGRTALYTAHSVLRAIAVVAVFFLCPEQRFFMIPLVVTIAYALTVVAIFVDSGRMAAQQAIPAT